MNIVLKSIVIAGLAVCGVPVYVAASDKAHVHEGAADADPAKRFSNLIDVIWDEEADFSETNRENILGFIKEHVVALQELCRYTEHCPRECCRAAFAERYGVLMETCITNLDKALARAEELGIYNKAGMLYMRAVARLNLVHVVSFARPFILRIAEAIGFLKESLKFDGNTGACDKVKNLEWAQRYIKRCCDAPEVGRDRVIADLQGKFKLYDLLEGMPLDEAAGE
ncbi:MAG: hypothetical protein WCJ17_00385 [bacterium]